MTGVRLAVLKFVQRFMGLLVLSALPFSALPFSAHASESWPSRTVTIVVPFSAGGSQDIIARLLAEHLQKTYDTPFVVVNRVGAGGNVATEFVAKSDPDGYTFVLSSSGPLANNRFLYKKLGYDPAVDLTPIVLVGQFPMVIATHKDTQFVDLKSYVALASKKPGFYEVGTPGAGTTGDLTATLLELVTNTKLLHVPFAGGAPALVATISKEISLVVDVVNGTVANHLKSGTLTGLAITSKKRFAELPDLPTAVEQGFPKLISAVSFALVGPAKISPAIVQKLNAEVNRWLSLPAAREKLLSLGAEIVGGSPEEVTKMIQESASVWKPIIEASGVKPR